MLQTLHWDLRKHPEFYGTFDGKGRVFFNGVSNAQLATAPANLRSQSLGAVHLGVDLAATGTGPTRARNYLVLGRVTRSRARTWPPASARSSGCRSSWPAPWPVSPPRGELSAALEDPASPLHGYGDVRHYLDAVRPFEDGERIRWSGHGRRGGRMSWSAGPAVPMPISWE